jgi:hypothetical protein
VAAGHQHRPWLISSSCPWQQGTRGGQHRPWAFNAGRNTWVTTLKNWTTRRNQMPRKSQRRVAGCALVRVPYDGRGPLRGRMTGEPADGSTPRICRLGRLSQPRPSLCALCAAHGAGRPQGAAKARTAASAGCQQRTWLLLIMAATHYALLY